MNLSGQWLCRKVENYPGALIVDIEASEDGNFDAFASLYTYDAQIPNTAITFNIPSETLRFKDRVTPHFFAAFGGRPLARSAALETFPDSLLPNTANITFEFIDERSANFEFDSDAGTLGRGTLHKVEIGKVSKITDDPDITTWDDFKNALSGRKFGDSIFRGQSCPYPLQTSFHRTSKKILSRYLNEAIPILHKALSGRTSHFFKLQEPEEMGAFLNLAQHHGFPTPLLDWSLSPFVAAWFAFQNVQKTSRSDGSHVKIFQLEHKKLQAKAPRFFNLSYTPPTLFDN